MATEDRPLLGMIRCVREFEGGPTPLWYEIRGHVDKDEFVRELRLEWDVLVTTAEVRHGHARLIPAGPQMPGVMVEVMSEPGRGAFPITYVSL